ncbi:MAG: GIY-YIG nuclease family protein [Anaerolineae bacterium]
MAATDDSLGTASSSSPGTYALLLRLERARRLSVGRLGCFRFPRGVYVYTGSAQGPGGTRARIARHLRRPKVLHWHVDYLRAHALPVLVWLLEGDQRRECQWAGALQRMPRASIPALGFGSSDCSCPSHLIRFPALPDRTIFEQTIGEPVTEVRLDG